MMLDSIQADQFYELAKRIVLEDAKTSDREREAEEMWDRDGWRVVARIMAEMSPSIFRSGDHSDWSRCIERVSGAVHAELEDPPDRWHPKKDLAVWSKLD